MAGFNLADLFELVADAVPDRGAVVDPRRRLSYAELDARANRLAAHLKKQGLAPGDHIGLQLLNGSEYLEGMLAAFKLRAVPINVNYRYVEAELAYLFDDADLVALIYSRQFGSRVAAAREAVPKLQHLLVVDDGTQAQAAPDSGEYEAALAAADPNRPPNTDRSGDDRYIAYTGGTTGMPKGVVWRQEDMFFAAMGGGDVYQSGNFIVTPAEIVERIPDVGGVTLTTPPLMHVSAQWGVYHALFSGGKVVFASGNFDAEQIWRLVAEEKVNILTIVGDAMARPLADAFTASANADRPYEVSSLIVIGSGGAVLSTASKERFAQLLPNLMIVDGFGSSETGVVGNKMHVAGADPGASPRFSVNAQTDVLDDAGRPVQRGSGAVGRLARRGHVPLGYYKDAEKTAATFLEVDGERWVLPGDLATVDADGTVVLLGRGSQLINTGGEKVYPEEVETVLRAHPDVFDVLVTGVPDDHWGQRVVAIVQPNPGASPTLGSIREHGRTALAGFKLPRELVVVDRVERTPAGKADYRWARRAAEQAGDSQRLE